MALIKYNKNERFPSLFNSFFNDDWFENYLPTKEFITSPLADIIETDNAFNVELMLAGFDKKDIKLEVNDDTLTIEAERKKNETNKYNKTESFFGKVKRSYSLPNYVDSDNINAEFENGILKVTIPKVEEKVTTKLIEIK
jgi:HSP20 family protein